MKVPIISLSGHIGSGKNYIAELIASRSQYNCECHSFADKVRDVTEILTGIKREKVENTCFVNDIYNYTQEQKNLYLPTWGITLGEFMQKVGTDVFRNHFDIDTWVKSMFDTHVHQCKEKGHLLFIPDNRFHNEADAVLKHGGIVIRINGDPKGIRANSLRDLTHESETALDDYKHFSYIINNDGLNREDLLHQISTIITECEL